MDIDKKWLAVGLVLLLLAFAGGAKYESFKFGQKEQTEKLVQADKGQDKESSDRSGGKDIIMVYVVGEVKTPGVYRLQEGDRVFQAIEMAGGANDKADLEHVDMARKLVDEDTVDIAAIGEAPDTVAGSSTRTGSGSGARTNAAGKGGLININTASAAELDILDGIGPTLAQRIIDYRAANGPFATVEDINNVSGIGDKKFEAIKNSITVR